MKFSVQLPFEMDVKNSNALGIQKSTLIKFKFLKVFHIYRNWFVLFFSTYAMLLPLPQCWACFVNASLLLQFLCLRAVNLMRHNIMAVLRNVD
uniref:Uncharacterized protein n=1 Tax=Glossina palpalis gambiensis TaxID=67801 RepID=A0A1B0B1D2_9MUSC